MRVNLVAVWREATVFMSRIALMNNWNCLNVITQQPPMTDYQPGQWG
ncbi:hypothetical protein [Nonomuraea jiangxiensis]|uniref:Uncharacterized protein n=1 Tax=Nonomuraea jiangxiensis TaxID=633440 RepID=A0A1G9MU35_9ACTN|nr:hypothetical protein [Nonomuraea jiangxiensis]SDL77145.1 hypothetical protein SAMN05421869_130102 [Nonomuraea jiangxiensis]